MPLKAKRIDSELKSMPKAKAAFIEPMLLLRTETLPEGAEWLYELKLDTGTPWFENDEGRLRTAKKMRSDPSLQAALRGEISSTPSRIAFEPSCTRASSRQTQR